MKDWLKLKRYTHFSAQFEPKHIPFIREYVSKPENIVKHRFHPFIHYTIRTNRFRRTKDSITGKKNKFRIHDKKTREICYADHLDTQVFAYYANLLNQKLEEEYSKNVHLYDSVIAYRTIPFDKNRNKCNIDFANEVFQFIANSTSDNLTVLCFDIKSFFDTLDHKILKKLWCGILGQFFLKEDHYQVFRAITKFTYVELGDLIDEFSEFNIKNILHLRKKDIGSFCKSGEEFRKRVKAKGLINYNKYDYKNNKPRFFGIPQGSPISAVLSNLYMLNFDQEMAKKATDINGFYRRYSDDILFICPNSDVSTIRQFVYSFVKNKLKLEIQEQKTQEVVFNKINNQWLCNTIENEQNLPSPLSYLGFDFDGSIVRVRQKGLSLYYRNMKRLIRRKARYARSAQKHNMRYPMDKKNAWIYRRRIYKSKSHLGSKRKTIGEKVFWGNYISYIKTASKIMEQPSLLRQVRNHWRIIEKQINELEKKYRLEKTPSRRAKNQVSKSPLIIK
jgi:hypothetical protein